MPPSCSALSSVSVASGSFLNRFPHTKLNHVHRASSE
ncbi:hypothetical protein A2U01_0000339, partial [Trifolium medium]|nr:hypothetical protein [Trifolium medium]